MDVSFLDHRRQRLLRRAARLQKARKVAALAQLRDRQVDPSSAGVPTPFAVAIAVVEPNRATAAGRRAGSGLDLQIHHALGGKSQHLAHQIAIRPLLDQLNKGHSVVGHRLLLQVRVRIRTLPEDRRWPPHQGNLPTPPRGTRPKFLTRQPAPAPGLTVAAQDRHLVRLAPLHAVKSKERTHHGRWRRDSTGGAGTLALAIVIASQTPLVLLDEDLCVVAASISFYRDFDLTRSAHGRKKLADLGAGEWNLPQLQNLLKATLARHPPIEAYEMDLARPGHTTIRLVVNAQKLDYPALAGEPTVVLALSDVTAARLADRHKVDLLRERQMLLQELQHRVANSLQIIASVLLQSARAVNSEESRRHLRDAHNRVMSVASSAKAPRDRAGR